jgi:multidrug efflux pump subunit AcrB
MFEAGRRGLHPILMTALATVFGMSALAIGVGSGPQILQPRTITVIGGVTVSMLPSLLVTPVYLLSIAKDLSRNARVNGKGQPAILTPASHTR